MLFAQFVQKSHLFFKLLHFSQKSQSLIRSPAVFYSVMANESETSVNLCNEKKNIPCNPERPYEVVVAATRDMGIGKDGKLPWTLPSDLRFFRELTTTTTVDGKRNAVIMGRKTWESIPQRYQPLPGRLNVVLTRSGELEVANSFQDLVICNDLSLALKLLAEPPHSESIEKAFLIGGGQILKEAMNGPGCEAIHLTDIEANIECDTFIPQIDSSLFHPLFSSSHIVENNIGFSFKTYVRTEKINNAPDVKRETIGFEASSLSKRSDEFDYLRQIQENIAGRKRS